MDKQMLTNSLAICISNLDFVSGELHSPQYDLVASTTEILNLLISVIEDTTIEN